MKIQVKELGAIKEGTIDLSRKLNVFCGPNGTGKTYMAYVIYALTKLNNKSLGRRLQKGFLTKAVTQKSFQITIMAKELFEFRLLEIENVQKGLAGLFSISAEKAAAFFSNTVISSLESQGDFIEKMTNLELEQSFNIYHYSFSISKRANSSDYNVVFNDTITEDEVFFEFMEIVFLSRLYSFLSFYPITSATIFPVERNSIYTFVKELSIQRNEAYELLESSMASNKDANYFDILFKRSTRYPQPIRDVLQVAEDLENTQKRKSSFFLFANEIEKELLKGKVIISKEGGVEFSSDKAPKTKLSFHQSSSIVKTLASLVIYLKHEAQNNDLVIIDEPELNLHPNNQVILARIFSRLINKGLRLIISTHSDYIVREFNNLIMIGSGKDGIKEYANKKGYLSDEYLCRDDVAAYFFDFKKKAKQVEVQDIKIGDSGFEIPSVDETIDAQNEISEELFYTIKYGAKDE